MTMFQNLHRMMLGKATLKIRCEACQHCASWSREEALRRLGPDASPFDIRRKLVCAACGAPGRANVWI